MNGKKETTMKKILTAAALAVALVAQATDPAAPYDSYGPAMASTKEKPITSVWQKTNRAAIDAATADAVLAAVVADAASARALLAQVKEAYVSDPVTLIQIGAVTQWVMRPGHAAGARNLWVTALLATAESASDTYVKLFCLDQLRWCACACPQVARRVQALGAASGDKAVREMADLVHRTITAAIRLQK
jgi:hypothetical protein